MDNHEAFMSRCIELAALGAGRVSPNPMVGAVITVDGQIIGEGYHEQYGGNHAEVNAVRSVLTRYHDGEELLKRSTLYVSLEPCAHFGKTPPCTDLIIRYSIPSVVIATSDPLNHGKGQGADKLREHGIQVTYGILQAEAAWLNRRFFTRVKLQRPYIVLKWAQTSDGFFSPSDNKQRWITGKLARQIVHRWRAEEDAVLVGSNTARADNPKLNTRLYAGRDPIRMVVDRGCALPAHLYLFDQTQDTLVFNSVTTHIENRVKHLELENFSSLLPEMICYQSYLMDIQSILIEGGAQLIRSFIASSLWDEARIFTSPDHWKSGIRSPEIDGRIRSSRNIGADKLEIRTNDLYSD